MVDVFLRFHFFGVLPEVRQNQCINPLNKIVRLNVKQRGFYTFFNSTFEL